jgi:hypothetical protein
MEILKEFENATVAEIEARIEDDVNKRDAANKELLALNVLRDRKVKEERKRRAVQAFQAEHGEHPDQVVVMDSAVAGATVKGPTMWDSLKKAFGGG